jgi:hypothetical protein
LASVAVSGRKLSDRKTFRVGNIWLGRKKEKEQKLGFLLVHAIEKVI